MKKLFITLGMIVLLLSCSKEEIDNNKVITDNKFILKPYAPETVIENLTSLIADLDWPMTRSTNFSINDLHVLYDHTGTRSGNGNGYGMDSLMYYINFGNDEGYALLGVYENQSPVYAIVESGKFNRNLPQSRGYVKIEDSRIAFEEFVDALVMDIAIKERDMEGGPTGGIGGSSGSQGGTTYGEWRMIKQVPALINTKWTQYEPFNSVVKSKTKSNAAGCVTIAMLQIWNYYQHPKVYNGISIDWNALDKRTNAQIYDQTARENIAKVVYHLCESMNASYNADKGTGINSNRVPFYFLKYGYNDAVPFLLSTVEYVVSNLDKYEPVYYSGRSKNYSDGDLDYGTSGHAWIIDGYITRERDMYSNSSGKKISSSTQLLLHSNFGWGGLCDGYYVSGFFDTTKPPEEYDNKDFNLGTTNSIYNSNLRAFFTGKPKK